jgi:hypothetical protein
VHTRDARMSTRDKGPGAVELIMVGGNGSSMCGHISEKYVQE